MKQWFWLFWLILVCSTMGEGLECFFKMCYYIFPRVTIIVTTHVTIRLWGFCTISNALPLLVHYQICYCLPYRTFKYIIVSFSMLYHTSPRSFLKKKNINIFFKKLVVMHGNVLENWQLSKCIENLHQNFW